MSNPRENPSEKKAEETEKIPAYGGYSTRHDYERSRQRKSLWKRIFKVSLLAVLFSFSILGAVSLIRGDIFPVKDQSGQNAGSIKVPTQQQLSEKEKDAQEMLARVEVSLMTLEAELEDGSFRYGTGFLVSSEGYAVCAASFFRDITPKNITAYTEDGALSTVKYLGEEKNLGVGLVQLQSEFVYTPVSAENSSFVKRGERLYAIPSHKAKLFYGTVSDGVVASVGPALRIGEAGYEMSVNMIYLNMIPNASMYGSAVVDPTGAVVGMVTDGVVPPYEGLTAVVPINMVYTVVNDILAQ